MNLTLGVVHPRRFNYLFMRALISNNHYPVLRTRDVRYVPDPQADVCAAVRIHI